ncbi:hypothetical protein L484_005829 [Morus notabilis]|uniref:Uncharacterized protein n=1 Tax=Morus notabilis TaxID=981085 RepID=W9SCY0_9ROSA|nr:hypothetical protein L484_005829 [Morus notabilis]
MSSANDAFVVALCKDMQGASKLTMAGLWRIRSKIVKLISMNERGEIERPRESEEIERQGCRREEIERGMTGGQER